MESEPVVGKHVLIGFLALVVLPLLILLDTAIAFSRGWQTNSRLDYAVLALACLVVFFSGLALLLSKGRAVLQRRWRELCLVVSVTAVSWLAAEVVLELGFHPRNPEQLLFHRRWPNMRRVFRPEARIMPGIVAESRYTTNSLGMRGPELPARSEAYRILCIGGSTTECVYLDDEETWSHLLMRRLNARDDLRRVWVGNAGISGYATSEHLRFITQSDFELEVDVLLMLVGVNDFVRYLIRSHTPEADYRALVGAPGSTQAVPLWKRSGMLNTLRVVWHRWAHSYEVEDPRGTNYLIRRRMRKQAPVCNALPPGLEEGLRDFQGRVRAIVAACRQRGAQPVFATHPVLWDEGLSTSGRDLLSFGAVPGGRFLAVEKLREGMDRYNAALQDVCRQLGVACIDLSSMNGREEFFYDDFHFNEAGAKRVATLIADWCEEHALEYDLSSGNRSRPYVRR